MLRTCDAVGACLAVPRKPWIREALAKGNTLRQPSCVHWVNEPLAWLTTQRAADSDVIGVELTDESIRLIELRPARRRTIVVLGHESDGIPLEATALLDTAVEIPMLGTGLSLNVAVAASLVAYKLAGLV
jgi:tRNA (guanosine-2'-O-)-methyltransferase